MTLSPQDTSLTLKTVTQSANPLLMTYTWPARKAANAILMKFDLSAIPAGAVVTDATLGLALVQSDQGPETTYTVSAHKVVGKNPVITAATGFVRQRRHPPGRRTRAVPATYRSRRRTSLRPTTPNPSTRRPATSRGPSPPSRRSGSPAPRPTSASCSTRTSPPWPTATVTSPAWSTPIRACVPFSPSPIP